MRYLTLFVTFVVLAAADASSLELSQDIVADIEKMIEREGVRAVAIGLYDNGESQVFGFGRLSNDDARLPDGGTVFEIGSVSKVFTSLLVQVQVDAENLHWDQSIASCLPDIEFASAEVAAITLRELSTHTSGLPRLPDNMKFEDPTDPYAGYARQDLLSFVSSYKPDALAKEYEYSNLGAGLLGVIGADASNSTYADAIKRDVLKPLDLGDTHVGLRPDLLDRLAIGFSDGADMPNWDGFDALAGAGALVSTADDMLRFVRHSLNNSGLKNTITAIQQIQNEGPTAFAWHTDDLDDGETMLWHNGGTGGYASFVGIRPDAGTGVVILTTSTEYTPVTELGFAKITGRSRVAKIADVDAYPGAYRLKKGIILTIFRKDGRLYGQATGQGAFPLHHESADEFRFEPAEIRVVFKRDKSGAVNKMNFLQAGKKTKAPRVSDDLGVKQRKTIDVAADVLRDYDGRYKLAPSAILTVETRGDQLYVQLTGQQALPVFAYEPDKFFYKVVDAQLHFERDGGGNVDAVVLHQAGQQRAPKIGD